MDKAKEEKWNRIRELLAENSGRRVKMNEIARGFFIYETLGEKDAKEAYKEEYYRARDNSNEIAKLREELREIIKGGKNELRR